MSSAPQLERSPGEGHGNPLQYSCLENPMDRGAWQATVQWVAESDATEHTHTLYPLYNQIIMVNMVFFWSECHIFNRACKNNDSTTTTTKVNMAHQNQDCTFSPLCASSSAYLIGFQILEISNSGKSGPENFSKHKPYHIWMPTMWKALCWVYF